MIDIQDLILMILSGLASLVVAWYFARRARLGLFMTHAIPIAYQLQHSLPGLTVQYNNKPVSRNVTWLRGILANTGGRDITDNMIKSPIVLKLSGHTKWLSFSLKDEKKEVDSVIVEPKVVRVSLKMLARGEAVWFNGLVADWPYDDEEEDEERLSIDFRIAETSNAKTKSLSLAAGGHPARAIIFGIPSFIMMSIGIWFVLQGDVPVLHRPPSFHYVVEHEGRQIRYAELRPVAEGHYVPIERKWWHYGAGANGVRFETLTILPVAELFKDG